MVETLASWRCLAKQEEANFGGRRGFGPFVHFSRKTAPCCPQRSALNMAIDWSKIDKKSLAVLIGLCILFNWLNKKLVPWMESSWKWRAELKAKADKVRADWKAADEAEFAAGTKGKKKREGKKKK